MLHVRFALHQMFALFALGAPTDNHRELQTKPPAPTRGKSGMGVGRGVPGVPGISPSMKDGSKMSSLVPGELSKMRDTMRKSYCANGKHAEIAPCKLQGFLDKVRVETDAAKKKTMMEEHTKALTAEKAAMDPAAYKAKLAKDFFSMFDGYCAEGGEAYICSNKQLTQAKAKNEMPFFPKPKPPATKPPAAAAGRI